jgi:hypothetical protein
MLPAARRCLLPALTRLVWLAAGHREGESSLNRLKVKDALVEIDLIATR